MKRAFLYGLGTFLIIGVIALLIRHGVAEIIIALVLMPVSGLVIRAAGRAPPNKSRASAIIGGLLGFIVVDAVLLVLAVLARVITAVTSH